MRLVNSTNVDIVLLDLNISDNKFDGIELAEKIITTNKNIRIIIVTSFNMEELVTKSFLNGAVFFLLKEDIEDLPKIIHSCSIKNNLYEVLLRDYRRVKKELTLQNLTLTEKELYILKKEEGLSISQIAYRTKKSAGTIRNQLSSAYQKIRNHK
jgi:NarL family two-component system response regulator LiaR